MKVGTFSDGEINVEVNENVRGKTLLLFNLPTILLKKT